MPEKRGCDSEFRPDESRQHDRGIAFPQIGHGRNARKIPRDTAREYGFMLSALVVQKSNGMPSAGSFFDLDRKFAQEFRGKKGENRHPASHNENRREACLEEHKQIMCDREERLNANCRAIEAGS